LNTVPQVDRAPGVGARSCSMP